LNGVNMLEGDRLITAINPNVEFNMTCAIDVANVCVNLLVKPHKIETPEPVISVVSDRASINNLCETLSKVSGRGIEAKQVSLQGFGGRLPRMDPQYKCALLQYLDLWNAEQVPEFCPPDKALFHGITGQQPKSLLGFAEAMAQRSSGGQGGAKAASMTGEQHEQQAEAQAHEGLNV